MQKIEIDEKISIWQRLEITFTDNVDLSTDEKIKEAIKSGDFWNIELKYTYDETENHLDYDFETVKKI
jgi:hypothetical protein